MKLQAAALCTCELTRRHEADATKVQPEGSWLHASWLHVSPTHANVCSLVRVEPVLELLALGFDGLGLGCI
jgi:hypothetical protein